MELETIPNLEDGFALICLQRLSKLGFSYPAMLLTEQPVHQSPIHPGPLVLGMSPLKYRTPTADKDQQSCYFVTNFQFSISNFQINPNVSISKLKTIATWHGHFCHALYVAIEFRLYLYSFVILGLDPGDPELDSRLRGNDRKEMLSV